MKDTYVAFVDRMIDRYEGPYGWNRKDPGGPTKYGITCYDLAEHRREKMDSMTRWATIVKSMTRDEAEQIYREKYATAIMYDALPAGVDACVMDYAVNSGFARAVRVLRTLVGMPASDRMTASAVDAVCKVDPKTLIHSICTERLHFMHGIRKGEAWDEFGHGWASRVADLETYSDAIVDRVPPHEAPDLSKVATPKATHVDPELAKMVTTHTGMASTAATPTATVFPWWVAVLIVIAVAVGGYVVYRTLKAKNAALDKTVVLPPGVTPQGPAQVASNIVEQMREEKV